MQSIIVHLIILLAASAANAVTIVSKSSSSTGVSATGLPYSDASTYYNFSLTCNPWGGLYGSDYAILQATCNNGGGGQDTTSLNLNDCIAYVGTELVCMEK